MQFVGKLYKGLSQTHTMKPFNKKLLDTTCKSCKVLHIQALNLYTSDKPEEYHLKRNSNSCIILLLNK